MNYTSQDVPSEPIDPSITSQENAGSTIYQYRNRLVMNAYSAGKHLIRIHPALSLAFGPLQPPDGVYASQREKEIWESQSDCEWDAWEDTFGGTEAVREQCQRDTDSEIGTTALSQEIWEQQDVKGDSPSFMFKVVSRARSKSIAASTSNIQNSAIGESSVLPVPAALAPVDRQPPKGFSILPSGSRKSRTRSITLSKQQTPSKP
ncbi:uncharacterized protein EI90DRAFT_672390 [Cantharellus anzutake]|uniref:uncharacterized protein n=1 Tax=Cantharellus anzutake TaxID=1750568 RepID=UPI00190882C3|nr:uncharacterized protein EI90DRAFT_672390 [Cantharellus anzutake]KAF8332594.1 hypothetical protein EI90DRAFT_672390 [Cantharellus anzutake]